MIGVHTGPGATQLARSPYCTTSWAKPSVKVTMDPLVGEEGRRWLERLRGAHVYDRAALRHVRDGRLDEPEHSVDVSLERLVEQFRGDVDHAYPHTPLARLFDHS